MANNIVRGTTPTLTFTLPFGAENVAAAFVTFEQHNSVVLDKEIGATGCACEGNTITLHLSQEDTLLLCQCDKVDIQLRIRTVNGEALASQIITVFVEEILKDGVI